MIDVGTAVRTWDGCKVSMQTLGALLEGEGWKINQVSKQTLFIENLRSHKVGHSWFAVWDNGGEIGVERLNSGDIPWFVPTTQRCRRHVGPATLLVWLLQLLRGQGEHVNYTLNMERELREANA